MSRILSKILVIVLITIILLNMFANNIYAVVEIVTSKAYIETIGYADDHLKYYREAYGYYTYHKTIVAGYKDSNGKVHPAYCLEKNLPGSDKGAYYVKTESLIKDQRIWRIIKNGYPYKSAKELGLTKDYDAYAVTRYAIYCVLGQEKLEYFKAESDDPVAVKMLKVLKNLVKIGKEGKETANINPLSTEKVGEFKEDGEYYVQEYKVKSTADFKNYKITKTSGMPKGAYIADKKGNKTTSFTVGNNFYVMIPKTSLTNDININMTLNADCKVYAVIQGDTTVSGTQNYAIAAGEYYNSVVNVNFKKSVDTGKVLINKVDKDSKVPLEGIEFQLLDKNGKLVDTKKTNSKGIAEFENLIQGKYTLVETKTNENYVLLTEKQTIEVKYNKTTEIKLENEYKKRKSYNI